MRCSRRARRFVISGIRAEGSQQMTGAVDQSLVTCSENSGESQRFSLGSRGGVLALLSSAIDNQCPTPAAEPRAPAESVLDEDSGSSWWSGFTLDFTPQS